MKKIASKKGKRCGKEEREQEDEQIDSAQLLPSKGNIGQDFHGGSKEDRRAHLKNPFQTF